MSKEGNNGSRREQQQWPPRLCWGKRDKHSPTARCIVPGCKKGQGCFRGPWHGHSADPKTIPLCPALAAKYLLQFATSFRELNPIYLPQRRARWSLPRAWWVKEGRQFPSRSCSPPGRIQREGGRGSGGSKCRNNSLESHGALCSLPTNYY